MSDHFEKLIEARLEAELGPIVRSAAAPQRAFAGSPRSAALLTTRTLAMAMAAVLAVGGGFIAATAATGSASPAEWTLQVKAVVTQCKTTMAPGERGIGHCVSDNAEQAASAPAPTTAPTPTGEAAEQHPPVAANPGAAPALVKPATAATSRPAVPAADSDEDREGGRERPPGTDHGAPSTPGDPVPASPHPDN